MNDVLKRIEILRVENNVKAKDICAYLDIEPNTYSSWKNRNRTPDANNIVSLAEYFNVSTDFILTGAEHGLTEEQRRIVRMYDSLNDEGKEMYLEYGEFLSTRYIKNSEAQVV